ncbi:unnamed protein product [Polarella glacialis]|uniref:FAS1 domain-containing protein n=1 Tax=Polarella glacialis TaxID=89957 RepID=A0A813J7H1_POLGL|nr:unnamed protein product [Polarella glacialis]
MALQSAPGSVFVLANSAPSAFRGSALATSATGGLAPAALADASAPRSVNPVGLAAVGATLAAAASTRRRGQKVGRMEMQMTVARTRMDLDYVLQPTRIVILSSQALKTEYDNLKANHELDKFKEKLPSILLTDLNRVAGRALSVHPATVVEQALGDELTRQLSHALGEDTASMLAGATLGQASPLEKPHAHLAATSIVGVYPSGEHGFLLKMRFGLDALTVAWVVESALGPALREPADQLRVFLDRNIRGAGKGEGRAGDGAKAKTRGVAAARARMEEARARVVAAARARTRAKGMPEEETKTMERSRYRLEPPLRLRQRQLPPLVAGVTSFSSLPRVPTQLSGLCAAAFSERRSSGGRAQNIDRGSGMNSKYGLDFMTDTAMVGEPGNYGAGFPTFLGKVSDPEARKTKLAAELANGRLAMMAIIGMFFQDGLIGSAWAGASGGGLLTAWAGSSHTEPRPSTHSPVVPRCWAVQLQPVVGSTICCVQTTGASIDRHCLHGEVGCGFLHRPPGSPDLNGEASAGFARPKRGGFGWVRPTIHREASVVYVAAMPAALLHLAEVFEMDFGFYELFHVIKDTTAIANGNFAILVRALQKAGLVETVSGETPYTVFAPTDAAFADLLKELGVTADQLLANPDLKSILLHQSSSLRDGMRVTSAEGGQLAVQIGCGNVKVGRATVLAADLACSTGVIHVIDKVLLPPAAPAAPFDPAKQIGAMAPLGFFDPLGFSKKGDKAGFNNLQASEIKHGRVERTLIEEAMMAALGAVVQHYVKFPGFESVPSGLGAVTTAPGTYGFAALFLVSGVLELAIWTQDEKKEPGNFGDPAGLNMYNPEMREKEINNGRMGMFSAIGIIAAEALSGKDGMNQLGF